MQVSPKTFIYQFLINFLVTSLFIILAGSQWLAESHTNFISRDSAIFFGATTTFVIIILALPLSIYSFLKIKSYEIKIDSDRVTFKQGVIVHSTNFIPFNKIQDIVVTRNILERLFNFATLYIQTAAQQRPFSQGKIQCLNIEQADLLQKEILSHVKNAV